MKKLTAEFIGIMLGDGHIGIYDCKAGNKIKKHYQLKVSLDSRNKQYTNHVFKLMRRVFGVEPKIYFKKKENAVDIGIFRKEKILYALEKLGLKISPKWGRMQIPREYMKQSLTAHVLRGLFDTDGSVTIFSNNGIKYPRIEIRICPSPAQDQVINIIKNLSFRYKVQKLERGKVKIRISGKEELNKWFKLVGSSNISYINRAKQFL